MVRLRHSMTDMEYVILRTDIVLGCAGDEDTGSLEERIVRDFSMSQNFEANNNRIYSPVSVKDLANAVLRCCGVTVSNCYHAAGNEAISETGLAELIREKLDEKFIILEKTQDETSYALSNEKIKKELEWVPFYTAAEALKKERLKPAETKEQKNKRGKKKSGLLAAFENIFLFAIFAVFSMWSQDNALMIKIDIMSIYIVLCGLAFGISQSLPAIIFSCVFYILQGYESSISVTGVLTNVGTLLQFAAYIFVGVATGYTVDFYKLKIKEKDTEYQFLDREYEIIKEINHDNFIIKREYQNRLLNYKTSMPKLYSVIERLTVLEPERIFSETINAVKEIMEVETVAVYLAKKGSSYMRLIVSSQEKAVVGGKSWNMTDYPDIEEAFRKDDVFLSLTRNDREPAMAAPIYYQGECIAALVIKEVPFAYLNLNYTNLFRTLTVMITSAIVKAKDYENAVRNELYIPDSEIFYPYEFKKIISIAVDKKDFDTADYCVLQIMTEESILNIYQKIINFFRNTDFLGIDDEGRLFVLLGNTDSDEAGHVIERMQRVGVEAKYVSYEELQKLTFRKKSWNKAEDML